MSETTSFAAVQAFHLLAASAFTQEGDPYYAGIKIEPHPSTLGVLVSSTTGKQVAVIHDGHGTSQGPVLHWIVPAKSLAKELKKIEDSSAKYYGDIWVLLAWDGTGTGSLQLFEADSGAQALRGDGKLIKTILRDSDNIVIKGETPSTLDTLTGATAVARDFAPNHWFMPYGMERVERFAMAITGSTYGAPAGISFLRTKRDNIVQVAFRGHDEAVVFLATIRSSGEMRCDNPDWLDALL